MQIADVPDEVLLDILRRSILTDDRRPCPIPVERLAVCGRFRTLLLQGATRINIVGTNAPLQRAPKCQAVHLHLSGRTLPPPFAVSPHGPFSQALAYLPIVTKLSFHMTTPEVVMDTLLHAEHMTKLVHLSIPRPSETARGFARFRGNLDGYISAAARIPSLRGLHICPGGIFDMGCAALAAMTALTSLEIESSNSITTRLISALAAMPRIKLEARGPYCEEMTTLKGLQSLRINGDLEATSFAGFVALPSLTSLSLDDTSADGADFRTVSASLKDLHLSVLRTHSAALHTIARHGSQLGSQLTRLCLHDISLNNNDDGDALVCLTSLTNLQSLSLRFCGDVVQHEHVPPLLATLTRLTSLSVS
jgi:hypothetical protein